MGAGRGGTLGRVGVDVVGRGVDWSIESRELFWDSSTRNPANASGGTGAGPPEAVGWFIGVDTKVGDLD